MEDRLGLFNGTSDTITSPGKNSAGNNDSLLICPSGIFICITKKPAWQAGAREDAMKKTRA